MAISELLTAEQAANELGYNIHHLYRLMKSGVVNGEQFNRVWMIEPSEVERVKSLQGPGGRLPRGPRVV